MFVCAELTEYDSVYFITVHLIYQTVYSVFHLSWCESTFVYQYVLK